MPKIREYLEQVKQTNQEIAGATRQEIMEGPSPRPRWAGVLRWPVRAM
ncbi:hypothetical protein [Methanofollis fontis]|nr:hypothetical protein [Methanofollis fontis]